MNPEAQRLAKNPSPHDPWRAWGPYVSSRQWGTVREDYSKDGEAWTYFPHEHARSRAYRWGEDGIFGLCDREQRLCFAPTFWNGADPILKERFFGLTGPQGNHGEDVKEEYWYLEAAAQRFAAGHGAGLAVDGLADVTAALRDGAVDTLIIGDLGDATVVADHDQLTIIGPDADTVSGLGGSPDRVLRADEALPLLAVATGAALVRTDERIDPADGIGAVLRYPDTAAR